MRKNSLVICCATCVSGAFGAFFRWLLDLTGFETDTGLYISGTLWSILLTIVCIAAAVILLAFVLRLKLKGLVLPREYARALGGTTVLYKVGFIAVAVTMAAGSVLLLLSAGEDKYPVFQFILAALGLLGAVGFILMAVATRIRRDPPLNCFGATLIVILYCFWLIVSYRENAASPVVWGYAMEVLALCCSLVAVYYIAGIPFGRPKPFAAAYFSQLGAFLCIVTLPDDRYTGQQLMLIATAGMLLFFSWMIIANLSQKRETVCEDIEEEVSPE